MKLTLYYNSSDINVLGKTLNYVLDLNGYLRNVTSILSPIIDIEVDNQGNINYDSFVSYTENDIENDIEFTDDGNDYDIGLSIDTNILICNYAYIEEFNRYYFIDDIVVKSTNIYTLVLKLDVLETYRTYLLETTMLINRNEFTFNSFLEDEIVGYRYNKEITYTDCGTDASSIVPSMTPNVTFSTDNANNKAIWGYIIGSSQPDRDNSTRLRNEIVNPIYNGYSNTIKLMRLDDIDDINNVVKYVYEKDVALTYIKSLTIYPFTPSVKGNHYSYALFKKDKESAYLIDGYDIKYANERLILRTFRLPQATSYLDYSPYTKYEIYIPFVGYVELSSEILTNYLDVFSLYYEVNYVTTETYVFIMNISTGKIVYTSKCNLGVQIPLNSTNSYELKNQRDALATSTAIGLISSVISIGAGAYTGNAMMVAGGIMGATTSITNAVNKSNQLYDTGKVDITTSESGVYNELTCHLKITKMIPQTSIDYPKYFGLPLKTTRKLKYLKGYTQVLDCHLDNLNATNQEISMLDGILKKGFIIE